MPTFPTHASLRVVGPSEVVILVVGAGVTAAPLQILNESESGVAEIAVDGQLNTIAGAFLSRGPSLASAVETTS